MGHAATRRAFVVEGMTCDHCAATLQRALGALAGVRAAAVSYPDRHAVVEVDAALDDAALQEVAAARGYGLSSASAPASGLAEDSAPERRTDRAAPRLEGVSVDLVVIGSGAAAFGAALKASELGARVAMVARGTLGGTCVNVGCVPSKTLLRAAEALHRARRTPFAGLALEGRLVDFGRVVAQKDALVDGLRSSKYADVLRGHPNIRLVKGDARFVEPGVLRAGDEVLRAERFIVATGARPAPPSVPGLAEAGYLTSTTALELRELPPSLLVLGGRYIALELGQMFARFGTRVTIVQRSDHLLPGEDDDVTEALAATLREEGIEVLTGAPARSGTRGAAGYALEVDVGGERRTLRAAQLLAATGRRPNTEDLGLERIGARVRGDGAVEVDDTLATSVPGVYAAGDVAGEPAFVYTAAYEGALAAENALSSKAPRRRDYGALPWVMFTDPQLAVVGLNEKRAQAAGLAVDVARLPLAHVPRAIAARDTRGFIKLVRERGGDRLLGAMILAPEAGDLIMEPALAIRHGIGVSALAAALHPYLTQAEGIRLAALAFTRDVGKLSCCAA